MVRGNNKPAPKASAKQAKKVATSSYIPVDIPPQLQQKCLDIFRNTFQPDEQDPAVLQEVKGHLYNRDFAAAFGKEDYLRVYASRWSPSRALGYVQVLVDIQESLAADTVRHDGESSPYMVVCLGGGAGAEVVALAGWKHLSIATGNTIPIDANFIDISAWHTVVQGLRLAVTTPPELSKYASAAAKEANTPLVPGDQLTCDFQQIDALQLAEQQSRELYQNADLITLMFTLNELYSTSMPKTQQMLSHLTASVKPGACLLVVDSPGSYSTVSINGAEKKYPMQWLLDYTLVALSDKQKDAPPRWEKLVSDDSRWFRIPQALKYPIELENMRYQIHLYRRLEDGSG